MKQVWKYILKPVIELEMPEGAELLYIDEQDGNGCLWVLVNPEAKRVTRQFRIYGTGESISDNSGKFVGTFMVDRWDCIGRFVFHVFEV